MSADYTSPSCPQLRKFLSHFGRQSTLILQPYQKTRQTISFSTLTGASPRAVVLTYPPLLYSYNIKGSVSDFHSAPIEAKSIFPPDCIRIE